MTHGNSISSGFDYRLAAGSLLVLLGLALPFIPVPGNQTTRMAVRFRTEAMAKPKGFIADAPADVCAVLAAALAFEDRATGRFTRIDCGKAAARATAQSAAAH